MLQSDTFGLGPISAPGHFRRFEAVGDESGLPPTPDVLRRRSEPTLWANKRLSIAPYR
jgi:hypothetical protein